MIDPVASVDSLKVTKIADVKSSGGVDFTQWLDNELETLNGSIKTADASARGLALGEADNLHQVMINLTTAKSQFELAIEVRNRLVDGLKEMLRMSV